MAYLYRDNYPSNEVDILHNSQSLSPLMPPATSTKGVSCSVAGAGKVTLIGSNCAASRVGRCVDCEGGRTAQIFSDCAITKYLSRATARRPCGRPCGRQPNNSLNSCYCLAAGVPWSPGLFSRASVSTGRKTIALLGSRTAGGRSHGSIICDCTITKYLSRATAFTVNTSTHPRGQAITAN